MFFATLLAASAAGLAQGGFEVPEGFDVRPAADVRGSFLALTFDAAGRLVVATEEQGVLSLADGDGDGFFEDVVTLAPELQRVQGLCADGETLFAVGRREREGEAAVSALWRLELGPGGRSVASMRALVPIDDAEEHGAHAVVRGPDGALYVAVGDQARFARAPEAGAWAPRDVPPLLPAIGDPGGFGAGRAFPYGFVARVDPADGSWRYHSTGYRNPYDLAFTDDGALFTCESDMEWDVGLPWYRPVRVLECVERTDQGSRPGSAVWPQDWPEVPPAVLEIGRGSPTGVEVYEADLFPPRWRGTLLFADWTAANVRAVFVTKRGDGQSEARAEVLVQARGAFGATDLEVGPDGALYVCSGGRGTRGELIRVGHGEPGPPLADALARALRQAQPESAWGRAALAAFAGDEGRARLLEVRAAALDGERPLRERINALRIVDAIDADVGLAFAREVFRLAARDREETDPALRSWIARRWAGHDWGGVPFDLVAWARGGAVSYSELYSAPDARERAAALVAAPRDRSSTLWALRFLAREAALRETGSVALITRLAPALLAGFPSGDRAVDREAARLVTAAAQAGSPGVTSEDVLDALLAELERTASREQAIHYAYCLRSVTGGWTRERLARLFEGFEEAAGWSGGGSFQGYFDAMLGEVVDRVPVSDAVVMSGAGTLGPRVLASFLARKDPMAAAELLAPLRAAFAALDEGENATLATELKRSLIVALAGARAPGVDAFAREVYEDEPRLRGECLLVLARFTADEDWERFVVGLEDGDRDVREACIASLLARDRIADDAPTLRGVLDAARARGPRGGRKILRVLARWSGRELGPADADWAGELAGWERWFAQRFPDFVRPAGEDRPRRDLAALLDFLERTEHRPGSAARGAEVFVKATCHTCHTMAGSGGGWGPDLTDVAGRFDRRELLESIVDPSRVITDRYHVTRVVTHDGDELEGRLVEDAPERLVLLRSNNTRVSVARADTSFVGPSDVSAMPDGLLDALTLEEVKDLDAYLAARGVAPSAERSEPGWIDVLGDSERTRWGGTLAGWRLADGMLVGRAETLPRSTYLVYDRELADFELEFDVKAVQANTGVQYRSRIVESEPHPVGYQADIGQSFWGALYATDGRGLLARPEPRARNEAVDYPGWNHVFVRVDGDRHVIEINGHPMVDVRDDTHPSGVFALQLHEKMDMTVSFANLRVRPLR